MRADGNLLLVDTIDNVAKWEGYFSKLLQDEADITYEKEVHALAGRNLAEEDHKKALSTLKKSRSAKKASLRVVRQDVCCMTSDTEFSEYLTGVVEHQPHKDGRFRFQTNFVMVAVMHR